MKHSQDLDLLAAALATAQGQIGGAHKVSENLFFKSRYADLRSVWAACREPLANNSLALIQTAQVNPPEQAGDNAITGISVTVTTLLAHASGQWVTSELQMWPRENTPQAIGSCISYARRYSLAAMVGVYQEDDDAEAAHGRTEPAVGEDFSKVAALPAGTAAILDAIHRADVNYMRLAWNDATGLGTTGDIWKLLNTKQKAVARELLQKTMATAGGDGEPAAND